MKTIGCTLIAVLSLLTRAAAADVLVRTAEPVVSVSVSASFSLGNPPPYDLAAEFPFSFVYLYFDTNLGTLDSVTADFDIFIPVFVNGSSQSVFLAGDTANVNIVGTADAEVRLEGAVISTAVVPFTRSCTVVGDGDGIPDLCTVGDGSAIDSTPAGVLTIDETHTFTGGDLAPFLIDDGMQRLFLDVAIDAVAGGEMQVASVWARTFGTPEARAFLTLTYNYTPGGADADADGVVDNADNCSLVYNPDQYDSNGDQIGSLCDADITGPGDVEDCTVNFLDLQDLKTSFFANPASPTWNPDADLDNSGLINFTDLQIMKNQLFGPPGPSATGCN